MYVWIQVLEKVVKRGVKTFNFQRINELHNLHSDHMWATYARNTLSLPDP